MPKPSKAAEAAKALRNSEDALLGELKTAEAAASNARMEMSRLETSVRSRDECLAIARSRFTGRAKSLTHRLRPLFQRSNPMNIQVKSLTAEELTGHLVDVLVERMLQEDEFKALPFGVDDAAYKKRMADLEAEVEAREQDIAKIEQACADAGVKLKYAYKARSVELPPPLQTASGVKVDPDIPEPPGIGQLPPEMQAERSEQRLRDAGHYGGHVEFDRDGRPIAQDATA
ncbi:MAG: hypothetical protein ACR2RB_18380 [Gammaproteobacteria bacterium]